MVSLVRFLKISNLKLKLISLNDEKLKDNPFIELLNALCFKLSSQRRNVAPNVLTAT